MRSGASTRSCDRVNFPFAFLLLACTPFADAFSLRSPSPSTLPQPHSGDGDNLSRRDDTNDTLPSAISISPSQYWDGNDGPWSSFPLQVGSGRVEGRQNVRVMPSTAGTAIWTIADEGCPEGYVENCNNERGNLFLPNQSLTWTPKSIYQTGLVMNLGMDSSGEVGYDVVQLGWDGSGGPTVDHSIIWNLADSQYWLGIFGLNPRPTNFTTYSNGEKGFLQTLYDNGTLPSLSWAYTAGNQYRLNKVYGSLTLGGYDSNRFEPNDVSFTFYEDVSRDLSVNLHSIVTDKGSPKDLLPDGSISTFIDSTVAEIWLPESACDAFEAAFGLEYDDVSNHYLLNASHRSTLLDRDASLTFTISPDRDSSSSNTVAITFPYAAFDLQLSYPNVYNPNTSYYFPLQRAANDSQYTLGRTFLQEAYLIADYEHGNFSVHQASWDADALASTNLTTLMSPTTRTRLASAPSPSTTSSDSSSPSLSAGASAGSAIGAAAAVVLAALTIFLLVFRRHRRHRSAATAELDGASNPPTAAEKRLPDSPTTASSTTSSSSSAPTKPFISAPIGGELDSSGTAINELSAQARPQELESGSPNGLDPNKIGFSEMEGGGRPVPSELDGGGDQKAVYERDRNVKGDGVWRRGEGSGAQQVFEMEGSAVGEESAVGEGRGKGGWI